MFRTLALTLAIGAALALPAAPAFAAPSGPATHHATASKAQQLEKLYAQYWEEQLRLNPLQATFQGDPRYNDQLPDFLSADFRARQHAFTQGWLDRVTKIGSAGLSGQDLISYQIFVYDQKMALEGERYPDWMIPINQFYNLANFVVMFGSGTGPQPFRTVKDYDNWLKRASQVPAVFDQAIANMKEGVAHGVVQPKVLMQKVVPQLDAVMKDKPEDTLFWGPVKNMPADFPAADKARLTGEYRKLIADQLMPAYHRLRDYIADDYMPHTRDTVGIDALPDGAAWYAYLARQNTTTDRTPAQIHQLGLDEVARIHGEMQGVMQQVGFKGSLQDFFQFMRTDPRFTFKTEDDLLKHYRGIETQVMAGVPKLFSLTPKSKFEIRPVEAYRAQSSAAGEYNPPSEDGSRPGVFYVNTYDLPSRRSWEAEDLFLHEAIPGHHFQMSLQQELTSMPAFRRFGGENAFAEGWGLYSESLGKDLGMYQDPYEYFGYLQNELWRAIRLVVDTGLHSKGWTREQVIRYMLDNSAVSETDAVAEAERYMAIPGQALAYKSGELKIKELRAKAQQALGPKFDIRAFHAEVLKDGAVPLDVLEGKVDRWIASQQG
ncbi:MAG TPA: DUF885 family protein [Xanthomonadaceae bacterium]|nr:DUF885 family protein [Xanthomonadaceae bacterium]